jgi:hypothetical protein
VLLTPVLSDQATRHAGGPASRRRALVSRCRADERERECTALIDLALHAKRSTVGVDDRSDLQRIDPRELSDINAVVMNPFPSVGQRRGHGAAQAAMRGASDRLHLE